jgi:alpha-L-fucosidase
MSHAVKRSLLALAVLTYACATPAQNAKTASAPVTADPPAFVPYELPPQKAKSLAAWREASFGLFIHFGVYSTFGGEYAGRRSGAYAEWLMNNVKIPVDEYRKKVAGVFNPTQFNADEWAQTAKAAGMRYMVITSKHHDGFAMWDSKVGDYDVVDATPFRRDVIGELRDACRKHGILFGLYYSQSQDWSHPGGQKNTWDFPWQPTEKNWWRTADGKRNLEWAKHFERSWQYVNEKAMPQLEEIITKYDPDILWWDTGTMLPYEMTRAMFERANQLKPSIVMNDRNGESYAGDKLFDYRGTPDKPRYFQPVAGYWEAIPTTNESYGYSKWDKHHKKPSELIELLARAASKGGNVLLNVGPTGTGKFAPEDTQLLSGIGSWMKVNGEAIYAAERTQLPVQPWGTSSQKGRDLYLFVFDKPKNGTLVVGDLQSDPKSVTLLGSTGALSVKRLDKDYVQITLPASALNASTPVVKLAFAEPIKAGKSLPISRAHVNDYRIFDALLAGGVGYGSNTYARAGSTDWRTKQGRVFWPIVAREAGTYKVSVTYNRQKGIGGGAFKVAVAGQSLQSAVEKGDIVPDLHKGDVITRDLGTITVPAGRHELSIDAVNIPAGEELVRFIGVTFTPADAKPATST